MYEVKIELSKHLHTKKSPTNYHLWMQWHIRVTLCLVAAEAQVLFLYKILAWNHFNFIVGFFFSTFCLFLSLSFHIPPSLGCTADWPLLGACLLWFGAQVRAQKPKLKQTRTWPPPLQMRTCVRRAHTAGNKALITPACLQFGSKVRGCVFVEKNKKQKARINESDIPPPARND